MAPALGFFFSLLGGQSSRSLPRPSSSASKQPGQTGLIRIRNPDWPAPPGGDGSIRTSDQIKKMIRPTSQVAIAHPAPVKKPTQNQTPIRCRLTVEGILNSPGSDDNL
jgi:hypothetical protein